MKKSLLLNNIAFLFTEKMITIFLVFYSEGMIARIFTPEQYGQWVYSINFIMLLSALTLVIGAEVSVTALARNKAVAGQIIVSVFSGRMVCALFAFLVALLYAKYFIIHAEIQKFITILSFFLLFSEPFGVVSNYFQANVKILPIVIIRLIGLTVRTLIVLLCFYVFREHNIIPLARVIEVVTTALLLVYLIVKFKEKINLKFNLRIFKIILYRGVKFWPALLFMYFFQRVDRFFIEKYFSYEILSQYGIAVQLMEQAFLLLGIIIQTAAPALIYAKMSRLQLKNNLYKIIAVSFSISLFFCLLGYLLTPLVIEFIYGKKYELASDIAQGMLISLLFFSIDTVVTQYLYREKLVKLILFKWIVLSCLAVTSYYIAFEYFHVTSTFWVYNVNYFFMALFAVFVLLKEVKK